MSVLAALLLGFSQRVAAAEDVVPVPVVVAAPAASAGPLAAALPVGAVVDRVAAVVNDELITLSELYAYGATYVDQVVVAQGEPARSAAEREVLERLLERRLVQQEMRALKLDLLDQDIDRSIGDIAERNGMDVDALRKEIERSGMAWDQYRSELGESLRDMKFAQSVIRPRVTVTEDELRDAWLRTAPAALSSVRIQALVLAVPGGASEAQRGEVVARARTLREQAQAGADFGALSREHDQGPFGAQGGEMGVFKAGELVDTLDAGIVATPVGEVSEPIVLGDAVYLLRVAERIGGATDFASQRDQVADQVYASRLEDEQKRWFQEARRRAAIRILLPG